MPVTCTNYKLKCGGCPLLNQPYPDQLKHKQQLEQRLLGRFAPVSPVLGQAEPWHYRNKAIATFATGPRGRLTCGIYAAGTHRVLPYTDCLLQDTVINQTIAAVLEAARAWAAGDIKMPLARRKILDCHAVAKELANPEAIALCHAVGQPDAL